MTSGGDNWWQKQAEDLWLPAFVDLICRKLSDLADSQKQIITGMYPVPVGLAMQATVATVTGSVSQWQSQWFWFEFGREFYKNELIQFKVDCHYLVRAHYLVLIVFVYFMKLQMKFRDSASFHGFRFKSAIPRVFRDRGKSLALILLSSIIWSSRPCVFMSPDIVHPSDAGPASGSFFRYILVLWCFKGLFAVYVHTNWVAVW